jgi:hypothetical protein
MKEKISEQEGTEKTVPFPVQVVSFQLSAVSAPYTTSPPITVARILISETILPGNSLFVLFLDCDLEFDRELLR